MLNSALAADHSPETISARPSGLASRNIKVHGRRTSIRLEQSMWDALQDVCRREQVTINELCSFVAASKDSALTLTASLRVMIANYYRSAATEDGHMLADHGRAALSLTAALHGNRPRSSPP